MWKYYAFKIAQYTLAYLPRKIGYAIACMVADLVYLVSPSTRAAISDNMRHVLGPEARESAIRKATKGVLRNTAKNYIDLVLLPRTSLEEIEQRATLHGLNNLEDALRKGKGVILVTAHLGSFDTAVQIFAARSIKTTVLVEPLDPPPLLDHVTSLRASKGVTFMPAQLSSLKGMIRRLHQGEAVLLACDRDFTDEGVKLDFFGGEASLPPGAVRIAMRTGAAIVPAFNLRRADGRYDIFWEPAIQLAANGGNGAVKENLSRVARVMESYIRKDPAQWVVLRPIWRNGK